MKVPLLDLKPQYQSLKKELDEALLEVAESQYFILGPKVAKLEEEICEYLKVKYAIGVSSGTDALLIALMAADIQPGDEVIIPTYSFFATAGVVSRLNAVPVFVDSDPVTFNIDIEKIEEKITSKTKAIIPVHLFGQCAEMDVIMKIASDNNLLIIEDGAQAIGAQFKNGQFAGTIGDIGCYSFFPSKNLGCFGDGGMVVTNNPELAHKLKMLRVHGMEPKYYHKMIGGNFRLDAIQAAVLSVKFPRLDEWSQKRRENAELYIKLFTESGLSEETGVTETNDKNKILLPKAVYKNSEVKNYHIYNQFIIQTEKRDALRKHLSEKEIASEVYYPVPFHLQDCYKNLGFNKGDFPVSEYFSEHSIALPIFPELTEEQIKFVVDSIASFFI